MRDPYLTRLKREVLPGRRKIRMLREMAHHIEDGGGSTDRLGDPQDVAVLYNAIHPLWPRILCFFCLVFLTSVLIFSGGYLLSIDETPMESQLAHSPFGSVVALLGLAGMLLMVPGIYVSAAIFFPTQNFDAHFVAAPVIANLVWMTVYYVFLVPPPGQLLRIATRRLKS